MDSLRTSPENPGKAVLLVIFKYPCPIRTNKPNLPLSHRRRPLLPPLRRVESEGVGVTSSILPIFIPERARARRADCAPGPGVLVPFPKLNISPGPHKNKAQITISRLESIPPVALILICNAVMPSSLHRRATSWAANIAAYGEDSSRSALTFIPPVTRVMVSRPLESPRM